jgi:hypothetical protein
MRPRPAGPVGASIMSEKIELHGCPTREFLRERLKQAFFAIQASVIAQQYEELEAKHARRHRRRNPDNQKRNAEMRAYRAAGWTLGQLADEYGLTESGVRNALKSDP